MSADPNIIRGPRLARGFTILNNAVLRDDRLSLRARGLLVLLLSYPPRHTIRSVDLARHAREGRDAIRTAMRELEQAGYLQRSRTRQPDGTFTSVCMVLEVPQPEPENQALVPPAETRESPGHTGAWKSGAGEPGALRRTNREKDEEQKDSAPDGAVPPEAARLCQLLATRVSQHRGNEHAERWDSATNTRAMALLLARGPTNWRRPEAIEPERVERAINAVFDRLANPEPTGFCWADQIRSASALRKHWEQLRLALKRQAGAKPPMTEMQAVIARYHS